MREAPSEFESMREALGFLLGAWKGEFLALLRWNRPAGEYLQIRLGARGLAIDRLDHFERRPLGHVDLSAGNAKDTLEALARPLRCRDVVLQVDRPLLLTRAVPVAKASRAVLRNLLCYEVERLAPVPASDVHFDFIREERSADLTLRIVQKAPLDRALDLLHRAGLRVSRICLEDQAVDADRRIFPVDRDAWVRRIWRAFGSLVLATLAAILVLVLALVWELRQEFENATLVTQRSSLSMRAAEIALREQRVGESRAQLSWLEQERQQHLFGVTLAALTRLLPQDSWLRELNFDGREFHASGFAKNATNLIGAIDQSGEFAGAQFVAPVVHDAAMGADRFELTFQLRRSAPR